MEGAAERSSQKSHTMGGKLAVLAIFALALGMASFAWWWNYNRGKKTMEFYGPEAATLIRTAPQVQLLNMETPIDISKAPGLLNARTSLLSDASYLWNEPAVLAMEFDASVQFRNGEQTVTIDFDFGTQVIRASSMRKSAKLTKKTSDGWRSFIQRNSKERSR